jgi:hypothetical protein
MSSGLLKPKRQMSEKQMEALKRGREKRHQQMRTSPIEEAMDTQYIPSNNEPIDDEIIVKPKRSQPKIKSVDVDFSDELDDEIDERKMMKELKKKEHEMKLRELELKMSKLEAEYTPKKEEPKKEEPKVEKEEPKFIFRNNRRFIM